jgi:predicted GH43/DUF377 family glycosyl hydrolase
MFITNTLIKNCALLNLLRLRDVKLKRYENNPILEPGKNQWESIAVFNPAAFYWNNIVYLLYRAVGEYERYVSRIGCAISRDGVNFERLVNPIFEPAEEFEKWGVEDPRTVILENKLYMTYVAHSGRSGPPRALFPRLGISGEKARVILSERGIPRIALASLDNLSSLDDLQNLHRRFRRHGCITPSGVYERDTVLFPERINGKYVMLHRPRDWVGPEYGTDLPSIWIAYSENLKDWYGHKIVMRPEREWEAEKIGTGPPPIKTEKGWLLIYHGVSADHKYRAGVALLNLQDPLKVIGRLPQPILEPEEDYEKVGDVPNVVFPEGAVVLNNRLLVYYGAADRVCCVATGDLDMF